MKKLVQSQKGYGGIEMFLAAAVVGLIIYFFFFPTKFAKAPPNDDAGTNQYCRELIDDPNAPEVTAPSFSSGDVVTSKPRQYKLIKQNVLISEKLYTDSEYHHFFPNYAQSYEDPKTKQKFIIRIPRGSAGRSYKFPSDVDLSLATDFSFSDTGIIMLFHADEKDPNKPLYTGLQVGSTGLLIADIYKAVDTGPLPEWVLKCIDVTKNATLEEALTEEQGQSVESAIGTSFYYPKQDWSPFKAEEQLAYFLFKRNKYIHHTWWTPHCKPAVYLYPQQEQKINVQVAIPYGSFLYTDPIYPTGGWNVIASPNGELHYLGTDRADSTGKINYPSGVFPYLYYEARVQDNQIEKPEKGFVVAYDNMEAFYTDLLPKLGLNEKESSEFREYWRKALPQSPYYFIGMMPMDALKKNEPLTIMPKEDTMIRVRLYFEALDSFKVVQQPDIQTPKRTGFTVVDWGGLVKRDKEHSFTCLQ